MTTFNNLGLKKDVSNALMNLGFKEPREIQEAIIPLAVQGKNIVFTSSTGSGKTLAYLVPYLSKINKKLGVQMIVLVPTRELCVQVGKEVTQICEELGINAGVIYGGREIKGDARTLQKKNQIMIGTPGRLIQHINDKTLRVGDCQYLVFDESDQMFDDGFMSDCAYMIKRVSKKVQILLASATITDKVKEFMDRNIDDYELLKIGEEIPKSITQEKSFIPIPKKNETLLNILTEKKYKRVMVFCNTKQKVEKIAQFLTDNKLRAIPMSGELTQDDRTKSLNLFKEAKINILVTTDVAARGLHIDTVSAVINYDVPTKPEFYVHRIGRTGRSESKGYSLTFICPEDEDRFEAIESKYDIKIEEVNQ